MDALPWLVVHGVAVWRAALVLLLFGGAAVAWRRPRVLGRRAASFARADLAGPVDASRARPGARVTVAGELDLRGESPVLRAGDAVVRLDGPMTVLAGSHEDWSLSKAESRSLSTGDRVRVLGMLGEEAADDATSYRDAPKQRTLGGPLVAAFEGPPRVRGPGLGPLFLGAMAGATVALFGFAIGGRFALHAGVRALIGDGIGKPVSRIVPVAIQLAAASPLSRDQALSALVEVLDARRDPDPRALATRAELHELRGERLDVAEMWISQGDPEAGATLATDLGARSLAARGFYAAGDFERAADAWRDTPEAGEAELRFGVGLNMLAQRYGEAAKVARRLAVTIGSRPTSSTDDLLRRPTDTWYEGRWRIASCLATALEARSGDDTGARSMQAFAVPGPRACWLLAADLLQGKARRDALDKLRPEEMARDTYDVPMRWFDLLALEAGASSLRFAPKSAHDAPWADSAAAALVVPNAGWLARALPAVERALAEDTPTEGNPSSVEAAVFAWLAGDEGAARRLARDPATRAAVALPDDVAAAEAVVEQSGISQPVRRCDELAVVRALRDVISLRNPNELLRRLSRDPPPDEGERQAWAFTATGDGAALVEWLRAPSAQPGTFLRFAAPRLRSGQAEVAAWVRSGYRPVVAFRPLEDLVHLATLAGASRALAGGDVHETRALEARARRFRDALLVRETSVLLAVLDRL